MKKVKWYQYFAIGSFVAGWIVRASMDGKISRAEIEELVINILNMLEIEDINIE